jgi:hypothetical protein
MRAISPLPAPNPAAAPSDARASGRRLVLGRILWLAAAALGVSVLVASLAPLWQQLQTVCRGPSCTWVQLTPAQAQTLHAVLGLTPGAYALVAFSLGVASACLWVGTGAFLWRKLDQGVVLVMALQLIAQGVIGGSARTGGGLVDVLTQAHSPWLGPAQLLSAANWILLTFLFALFPTGRFVPRWMRWVAVGWVAFGLLDFLLGRFDSLAPLSQLLLIPAIPGILLLVTFGQIYRYLRVSTDLERQQTKWVLFSFIEVNLVQFSTFLPQAVFAPLRQPGSLYGLLATLVVILSFAFVPVFYMIAIQRWHLFAIDTITNRALVYGALIGLLGTLYLCLVIALESLVELFGGTAAQSPVVHVVVALGMGALFLPAQRRIQAIIDRRFYRKKYDAAKTLEAFGATLSRETDLEQIRERLLAVVQETMQPTQVSLWLVQPERQRTALSELLDSPEPGSAQPSESSGSGSTSGSLGQATPQRPVAWSSAG